MNLQSDRSLNSDSPRAVREKKCIAGESTPFECSISILPSSASLASHNLTEQPLGHKTTGGQSSASHVAHKYFCSNDLLPPSKIRGHFSLQTLHLTPSEYQQSKKPPGVIILLNLLLRSHKDRISVLEHSLGTPVENLVSIIDGGMQRRVTMALLFMILMLLRPIMSINFTHSFVSQAAFDEFRKSPRRHGLLALAAWRDIVCF